MGKYMDSGGLSHFMGKIKSWANGAFLKLSGGTLTGKLTLQSSQYTDNYTTGALDLRNSNIQGVNSIYTADASEDAAEGVHFYRDATHVDSIHAKDGGLYFTPNRQLGSAGVPAAVLTRSGMMQYVEMQTTNPFAPGSLRGPYISKIDNAFYAADKRWDVSATLNGSAISAGNVAYWFNGDYESRYQVAKSGTCVITMDFANTTYFPGYPYGYILVSFYYNEVPASVSGRVYCNYQSQGVGWHDISFSDVSDSSTYSHVYRSAHQGYYNISQLEITVVASSSVVAGISQIEMHLDRPYSGRNPFLSKYTAEKLYYNLTAPKFIGALQGNADTATNANGIAQANRNTVANYLINALSTGNSDPTDADYYISQYVGGGTTTTTYHRRPMSALWNYVKGKFKATMLSSATDSSSEELAATPKAVKAAYDLANSASNTAGQAMSAATGSLVFKVTYSVSGSTVTCAAHVYSAGQEVTSNHADSCFVWSMSLDGGSSWTSLGTGKTKAVTTMTAFGGNVKCDFTPAS